MTSTAFLIHHGLANMASCETPFHYLDKVVRIFCIFLTDSIEKHSFPYVLSNSKFFVTCSLIKLYKECDYQIVNLLIVDLNKATSNNSLSSHLFQFSEQKVEGVLHHPTTSPTA